MNRRMVFRTGRHLSWTRLAPLAGLLGLILLTARVQAQTPQAVTDDEVNRIASQLYCPVCENVTLDVCPTTACDRWRADIRSKLEAGWSDQEIEDFYITQYGARVIGTPPRTGFSWLLYAVAPLGAIGLALTATLVLRQKPGRRTLPAEAFADHTREPDSWRDRLEQDLRKDDRA